MYTGIYKIADHVFEVRSLFEHIHHLCADYAVSDEPAFSLSTTTEQIARERVQWEADVAGGHLPEGSVSDGFLETVTIHRALAERLVEDSYLLFHGSAVAVDGETYLFTALSGTGKSTHTRLWREHFGERAVMVNDDKPFLKITDSGITVYGTPWNGKHHLGSNISLPLKALCILERDTDNHIEPIDKKTAYPTLFQQAYRSADPAKMVAILGLLDKLGTHAALYRLGCNMQPEAAIVSYEGMNRKRGTTQ